MEQPARFSAAPEATRGLRFERNGATSLLDTDGRARARVTPPARTK